MSGKYSMMTLGGLTFGVDTAAYQQLERATEYLWPSQERFGNAPAVQFTGTGDETITLPGVIYPEWFSNTKQVDAMRTAAAAGKPLTMIDGRGNAMGKWVITNVKETQSIFAQAGVARKQEFSLSLKKYPEDPSSVLAAITKGISSASGLPGLPSGLPSVPSSLSALSSVSSVVSSVSATANAALSSAKSIAGQLGHAITSVTAIASTLGVHAVAINSALNRSLGVVNSISGAASVGLSLMGKVQSVASAKSAITGIYNTVSSTVQPATTSSSTIKASLSGLESSGASPETMSTVTGALVSANQATVLSSSLSDNSNTIINQLA